MWKRNRFFRQLRARPRLALAIAVAVLAAIVFPDRLARDGLTRFLVAWNVGTSLYLVLAAVMMARSSYDRMRLRARMQDEGQFVVLVLVIIASVASLVAIAGHLSAVKDMRAGPLKTAHIALAAITVLLSWSFTHTMMALHYAHDYYAAVVEGQDGGLRFPHDVAPDYWDFLYFACIIGTSAQTADVALTSKSMRHTCTAHCVLAFLFNTTVLALSINIVAGLL
jgi:uncharacterized membrane protein